MHAGVCSSNVLLRTAPERIAATVTAKAFLGSMRATVPKSWRSSNYNSWSAFHHRVLSPHWYRKAWLNQVNVWRVAIPKDVRSKQNRTDAGDGKLFVLS
jgi:hypothetical protein